MSVSRWDPFQDLQSFRDEMNRTVNRWFGREEGDEPAPRRWVPALDVVESKDAYNIDVEVPGLRPEDINVTVDRGMLTVQGERRSEEEKGDRSYHRVERRYGSFRRSISLPGTAAEILDDEVRAVICPDKVSTDEWLQVHRTAHSVGLRSNVTVMFGHVEHPRHWARHLLRTRALQRETGGFTEFVPLPFVHMAAPMYRKRQSRPGPTFREALLIHAVGRIAYHGVIDNIQVSWVKMGADGVRQALLAGVNDLGGTLMDENISRAAGASHGQMMEVDEFRAIVEPLGRRLEQRTTLYGRTHTEPAPVPAA